MKPNEIIKEIIGKKIKKAWIGKISEEYDDEPFLFIEFEDGFKIKIISNYGDYTSESEDEYPRYICIEKQKQQVEE